MAKSKQEQVAQEAPAGQQQAEEPQGQEEQPVERLNHWQAAHRVVKVIDGDTALSELADQADKLVVASGGKSNETRAWNAVWDVLQSMSELGILQLTEDVQVHPLHRLPPAGGGE